MFTKLNKDLNSAIEKFKNFYENWILKIFWLDGFLILFARTKFLEIDQYFRNLQN